MEQIADKQLIDEIALDLVKEIAPQEMPIYPITSKVFFENPKKITSPQSIKEEALGFGVQDAAVFFTPILLAVSLELVHLLKEIVKESLTDLSVDELSLWLKKILGIKSLDDKEQKNKFLIPSDKLIEVNEAIRSQLLLIDLPEQQVELIANAIVGRLSIST